MTFCNYLYVQPDCQRSDRIQSRSLESDQTGGLETLPQASTDAPGLHPVLFQLEKTWNLEELQEVADGTLAIGFKPSAASSSGSFEWLTPYTLAAFATFAAHCSHLLAYRLSLRLSIAFAFFLRSLRFAVWLRLSAFFQSIAHRPACQLLLCGFCENLFSPSAR